MDTWKKLSMAHKNTDQFSGDLMPKDATKKSRKLQQRYLSKVLLLASMGTVLTTSPGWAAVLKPTGMTVTVPSNSNNTGTGSSSSPYNDDILLNSLTFGGTTFQSNNGQFRAVLRADVISGAENVNAEYGDRDNGADKNPNPFVSAGIIKEGANLPTTTRESTKPSIQEASIKEAFSSLSVSQGVDGEGPAYNLQLIFQNGVVDNNSAVLDQVPELVFFERGASSEFTVRAITGGTNANPVYSPNTVTVRSNNYYKSGIYIDTTEITGGQELGVVGMDLNDFGLTATDIVYGVSLSSINNTGADIYGQFLSSEQPFPPPNPDLVPEPLTILGSGIALGFGVLMQRKSSRKLQKA
jgi:hypothetical protein